MKKRLIGIIAVTLICTSTMHADVIIPGSLAGVEGNGADDAPLGSGQFTGWVESRLQQVYGDSLLTGLTVGDSITGLTFRIDGSGVGDETDLPPQTVTNYEIRLSQSANEPGSLEQFFDLNRGADEIIVRSGPLTFNAGDFTGGSSPNDFGVFIPFTTPYVFKGGPLLLEIGSTVFPLAGRNVDAIDSIADAEGIFGQGFDAQLASIFSPGAIVVKFQTVQPVVAPDSVTTTRGLYVAGDAASLAESDNEDYQLQRLNTDIQSRTEFEVKGTSPTATPTSFEFTLEGAVFARSNVVQTIELFDYDAAAWVLVHTSDAARSPSPDSAVTGVGTGDLSRFVEAGTMCIETRIHFQSDSPRQRFASNTDQAIWTIGQ